MCHHDISKEKMKRPLKENPTIYVYTHIYTSPNYTQVCITQRTGIRMAPNFSTETQEAKRQNSEGKF